MSNIPDYSKRNKAIGGVGLTADINLDSAQIELITKFLNSLPATSASPAPTITSFSPPNGFVDSTVTVVGTNFGGSPGGSAFGKFNGLLANITSWSDTSISFRVPTGGATGLIAVTTPAGTAVSPDNFTVITGVAVPSNVTFSPATQQVGAPITVTGTNFTDGSTVKIAGVSANKVIYNNPTSLTVTVPSGIQGRGTVSVTNSGGTGTSVAIFTLQAASTELIANITTAGNSLTAASLKGGGIGKGWVSQMERMLSPTQYKVNNINGKTASGGWNIDNLDAHQGDVDATLNTTPGVMNILFIQEGQNTFSGGRSAADYQNWLNAYVARRRAAGWQKIVPITVTPNVDDAINTKVISANTVMINQDAGLYDTIMNLGDNLKAGNLNPSSGANPLWYPDGLHPSVLVETIMAQMGYDCVNFLRSGIAKPNPANYPSAQVNPGEKVVWATVNNVTVGTGDDSNSVWNILGSPQYGGTARSEQSYPAKDGICVFAEMTFGTRTPGFWGLGATYAPSGFQWIDQAVYFTIKSEKFYASIWSAGAMIDPGVEVGPNSRLRQEAYTDKIIFYRDGNPFYTLYKTITFPLYATYVAPGGNLGEREAGALDCNIGAG